MSKILIKNGRVIDPINNCDEIKSVFIRNGKIIENSEEQDFSADKIIDASGQWVIPGLIDLHVHLREPGFEHKETIETGGKSAAKGGFTTICCMPNTEPVTDNEIVVAYIKMKAEEESPVNILPIGSITKGQKGEELANIGKMAKGGICAISEDGYTVANSSLMKTAMKYASMFNLPIFSHCEDKLLVGKGQINSGETAALMGLAGISSDSEEVVVSRDIILARSVKARLHICHMSTKGSVSLLREAQARGELVTAEVTPHHFTLCDEDIKMYDTNFKMCPPLRSKKDVEALKQALRDNTIQVIATDHAPHHIDEKNCEFESAANGIVGLETALPLALTELVETGILTPLQLVEKMSSNPAKILSLESKKGHLGIGADADITIVDPRKSYNIDKTQFVSKGRNTPFDGRLVSGKVEYTIVAGKICVERGELI